LISDAANIATLTADQRAGHVFVIRTMRRFLDAYVKREPAVRAAMEQSPADGLPQSLNRIAIAAIGLPPAPTSEEFERLVMDGPVEQAATVYRQARARNPAARIFDESALNLYAFRYTQRKQLKEALELRRLAVEAFADSPVAAYRLGVTAVDAGQPAEARAAFSRALTLLDAGTAMSKEEKDALRKQIESRLPREPRPQ
jgi:tetratricopeptide (TPR) repeat protein